MTRATALPVFVGLGLGFGKTLINVLLNTYGFRTMDVAELSALLEMAICLLGNEKNKQLLMVRAAMSVCSCNF